MVATPDVPQPRAGGEGEPAAARSHFLRFERPAVGDALQLSGDAPDAGLAVRFIHHDDAGRLEPECDGEAASLTVMDLSAPVVPARESADWRSHPESSILYRPASEGPAVAAAAAGGVSASQPVLVVERGDGSPAAGRLETRMENDAAPELELDFDEALSMAIHMLRIGDYEDAERVCDLLRRVDPDDPDALHYSGVAAHHRGRSDDGIALIQRSLDLRPDQADCYSNLGIIYHATRRVDEAIGAYQRAIAINPSHLRAYNNLGILLRATGKPVEAEAAYRKALEIEPQYVDAYHNLGVLLASLERTQEAVLCYCKVTTLMPHHRESRRMLGLAYCVLGQKDKAIELYEQWLKEEPDHPVLPHLLAGCTGRDVPTRASDSCVQFIFDSFAASFESKLAHLLYRAPSLVQAMIERSGVAPARDLDVLDAGCGTGLCGPLVAPYARRLTGVDLSAGMIEQAKAKAVYDELVHDELTRFLRSRPGAYDLVVSADTLVYFGDLGDVAAAAHAALRPGGMLVFTLEELEAGDADLDCRLEPHGRYVHSRRYAERVLGRAGFGVEVVHAELRMESGVPVRGLVIRATSGAATAARPGQEGRDGGP
jgi:predicted TPR repeat methyltransferase